MVPMPSLGHMRRSTRPFLIMALAVLAVLWLTACAGGGSSGTSGEPTPVPMPSAIPTVITSPEAAVAQVIAANPRLTGIGALDPNLIGQSAWYEVQQASGVGAFVVTVTIGWGDCPAGCIERHVQTYAVAPDGTVTTVSESGSVPVPDDAWPAPAGAGQSGLAITALAGPVCPVERDPPDPACAPRPVADATVHVTDLNGHSLGIVVTDAAGMMFVGLAPGDYIVTAEAVDGLMGAPGPVQVTVTDGVVTPVQLDFDTGIR
jgi:hypothetical protein